MKRIAIVGSGISGVSAAYYLNKFGYDVSVFEAGSYFGGHTNTIKVNVDGVDHPIDTGFLVHNDRTYPNLIQFFEELAIEPYPSDMSFSVVRKSDDLIWSGTNLATVFADYKNLINPRFYRFLRELLKFNKNSKDYLLIAKDSIEMTLGDLLRDKGYSKDFQHWYLLPMGGCIWSTPTQEMLKFPAYTFLTFCMNHGLLQVMDHPQWKTVLGGCQTYVKKALSFIDKKFINEPVLSVKKESGKIRLITEKREELFDYCVFATHAPDTLNILKTDNSSLKETLSKFKYQPNKAVVHFDESILPRKKKAWAAWNYLSVSSDDASEAVSVSYLINKLQPLKTKKSIIVTLNPVVPIDPSKVVKTINYKHPLMNVEAIRGQGEIHEFQGEEGIYFAGAWMRYGFHEDGILSAKWAVKKLLQDDGNWKEQMSIL